MGEGLMPGGLKMNSFSAATPAAEREWCCFRCNGAADGQCAGLLTQAGDKAREPSDDACRRDAF
mgnify:CR=1 FL=1